MIRCGKCNSTPSEQDIIGWYRIFAKAKRCVHCEKELVKEEKRQKFTAFAVNFIREC